MELPPFPPRRHSPPHAGAPSGGDFGLQQELGYGGLQVRLLGRGEDARCTPLVVQHMTSRRAVGDASLTGGRCATVAAGAASLGLALGPRRRRAPRAGQGARLAGQPASLPLPGPAAGLCAGEPCRRVWAAWGAQPGRGRAAARPLCAAARAPGALWAVPPAGAAGAVRRRGGGGADPRARQHAAAWRGGRGGAAAVRPGGGAVALAPARAAAAGVRATDLQARPLASRVASS